MQHVSCPLVLPARASDATMGSGEVFLDRIAAIRNRAPEATFQSNFIVGYPGETEADHDELLAFVEQAQLDWCGFFAYSLEEGTHAAGLDGSVEPVVGAERLTERRQLQDGITAARRDALVGHDVSVLVDEPGVGRSVREAPENDGGVHVPASLATGSIVEVTVADALGSDLVAAGAAVDAA